MTDLRKGQYVYIRAKVVSPIGEQEYSVHKELAVVFTDAKGEPVSGIEHYIAIEDRPAILTLPQAITALGRMGK